MDTEITVSPDPRRVCLLRDTSRVRDMTLTAPMSDGMTGFGFCRKGYARALASTGHLTWPGTRGCLSMDMDVEQPQVEADVASTGEVQAFLIADIRGYSTFTSQRGAAAAAHLATTFTDLSRDAVAARGGKVLGLRGDEVLAAFSTAGQAVRATLDIQFACAEATAAEPDFPLGVGAGLDFGEAVAVDDAYHGAAINMAARLCAHAAAGQVLVTATIADAAQV